MEVKTDMTMTYELITPDYARELLANNPENRKISKGTVFAYSTDMADKNWTEKTGTSISIDADGILRDGQQRLTAVVETGVSICSWVCRNVDPHGIYDSNRRRTVADQTAILRPDLEKVYRGTRYQSIAKALIEHYYHSGKDRRRMTANTIIDYTDANKGTLDGYFSKVPQASVPKITLAVVFLGTYLAYLGGVDIEDIVKFHEILNSGMSTNPEEFPIIAYRNYLKDSSGLYTSDAEVARCQYALKKYLTKACTKRSVSPKSLIWAYPKCTDEEANDAT